MSVRCLRYKLGADDAPRPGRLVWSIETVIESPTMCSSRQWRSPRSPSSRQTEREMSTWAPLSQPPSSLVVVAGQPSPGLQLRTRESWFIRFCCLSPGRVVICCFPWVIVCQIVDLVFFCWYFPVFRDAAAKLSELKLY